MPSDLADAAQAGLDTFGRLDVVANAGGFSTAHSMDLSPAMWDVVMAVNLAGVWNICEASLPAIRFGHRGGSIEFQPKSATTHLLPTPRVSGENIAQAAVFLASDEARYITGCALPVDAGALLA